MTYQTVSEALKAANDKQARVYSVNGEAFVLADSPKHAALLYVGEDNVRLVTQRERYDALMDELIRESKKQK